MTDWSLFGRPSKSSPIAFILTKWPPQTGIVQFWQGLRLYNIDIAITHNSRTYVISHIVHRQLLSICCLNLYKQLRQNDRSGDWDDSVEINNKSIIHLLILNLYCPDLGTAENTLEQECFFFYFGSEKYHTINSLAMHTLSLKILRPSVFAGYLPQILLITNSAD